MEQSNAEKTTEQSNNEQGAIDRSNVERHDARVRETAARVSALLGGDPEADDPDAGAPEYAWALALVRSETFLASSPDLERETVTCQWAVRRALDEWGETLAPAEAARADYDRLADLCRRPDGMIPIRLGADGRARVNPILDHYAEVMGRAEDAHAARLEVLDDVLTVEAAARIREALTLAGVTDGALQEEICRCVLRGGVPFDGGNVRAAREFAEWRAGRADAP